MTYALSWKTKFGAVSLIALVSVFSSFKAEAGYPDRSVRLVVGFSAGGGLDIMARLIADGLTKKWGQRVLVENRPGADGSIGANYVARAPADGYTLLFITNAHAMPPQGYALPYDQVKSFAPATMFASRSTALLINPSLNVNSVKELIDLVKAKPGTLSYSSAGTASNPAMLTRAFMQKTGITLKEINYKGGGEEKVALLRGDTQMYFVTLADTLDYVRSGELKALAVTSAQRTPLLPDVPTIAEAANLPGYSKTIWNMILAPAGAPSDVLDQIYRDVQDVIKTQEVKDAFERQDATAVNYDPKATTDFLTSEVNDMAALYAPRPPN